MQKKEGKELLEQIKALGVITDKKVLRVIENEINSKLGKKTKNFKVLIIEDHLQIIESYKFTFRKASESFTSYSFTLDTAKSCEEAILKLNSENIYDIVLLDIRLTSFPKAKIYSGEDISIWIDKNLDNKPKIIINTFFDNYHKLFKLFQNINPDGFLTKEEADTELILEAIITVIESPPFYSNTILKMLKSSFEQAELFDEIDRELIYELSIGASMKDLVEALPISKNTVEKRKNKLFVKLNTEKNNLKALIAQAKRRGLI